jgi:DNA polymerase III epsilon subunit-like protein
MIAVFKGISNSHVLIFDAEYNEGYLIQFSGLLFRKIEKDIFQIEKSTNFYVRLPEGKEINFFIKDFTGITDSYLNTFGEDPKDAIEFIKNLTEIEEDDLLVVSHGLHNDRQTLLNNEVDLYLDSQGREIEGMCTYNAAKRLLNREKKLRLEDVAADAGIFLGNNHNAFDDAWATVSVFCLMCKLEEERKNEKLLPPRKNENN